MTPTVTHLLAATTTSGPEAVLFWILAPVAIGCALAMVVSRNAVHAALLLVAVFFCLAVFYVLEEAPFLAAVQIIVYAGAIMVLFLFVLMLVGVDRSDSLVETIRGHRWAAIAAGLGFAGVVMGGLGHTLVRLDTKGLAEANKGGNVLGIARLLFTDYVFAFEVVSALLIVAALGAMVLTHKERITPRLSQRDLAIARFAGTHPTPLPGPGAYATGQDVHEPALLPSGAPAPSSLIEDELDVIPGDDTGSAL